MDKKNVVKLTVEERDELERVVRTGKAAAWKRQHAEALLKMDQGPAGPGWTDGRTAEAFGMTERSLQGWRRQAVEQGPLSLLERRPRDTPPIAAKLDGAAEARLTMLACSAPPTGRVRWTLRLLAARLVELQVVESISYETVRRAFKKTRSSPGRSSSGAFRRKPMPPSSARWNKPWMSTGAPTIPGIR
jgi:hypothetical protein